MPDLVASRYILLAEDNPADVQLVREALESRAVACDLQIVADGEQAVRFIEQMDQNPGLNCPEILLLDLHLPKVDGAEILRRLRASERCSQIAVVVMTSSESPRDVENAARHAAVHYFRKPSTLAQFMQLGDVVKEIIARSGKADEPLQS